MPPRMAIVLAAGKGTRMNSEIPKVLHPVCGRPMIHFVLDAIQQCGVERTIVVVGYRADSVRDELSARENIVFTTQAQQMGTGHAVQICRPHLDQHEGAVLIVTGDSPLIQVDSVTALLKTYDQVTPACILGTAHKQNPTGLGRIQRDQHGDFAAIVEEKDTTEAQRAITEVNLSTYLFNCARLRFALDHLSNDNQQGEYYITDCPGILKQAGNDVRAMDLLRACEALSINTPQELLLVEEEMRKMGYLDFSGD